MKQLQNSTAIKAWLALMLFCVASLSWAAQVAGTIVQLSGPLMARKADGAVRVLSMKSEVESGDTLVTEKNTYAMVKFIDNSEITLKPSTTFKVENFAYDAGNPDGDNASFNLVKGGLRSVTGLLGKRNKEKFAMKTPSATIGIRGTTFIADIVPLGAVPPVPSSGTQGVAPGLYLQVLDGIVLLSNQGGSQLFNAGQFGFTPNFTVPPIVLPQNPGLKFTPPPIFNTNIGEPGNSGATTKPNTVDCEVR
ncbi:hypothetical protein FHW58_000087 [Duganella sp. 1224]|uniref:FecR family protein n=1 Tax=Duganella sp. 1224 TaxID=2587052 RepID=UPI0015C884BA|nr:FecR family protein [Duganella sp. 1224]NYE58935.1 hypothetical protein [Duganella sp. 1224]